MQMNVRTLYGDYKFHKSYTFLTTLSATQYLHYISVLFALIYENLNKKFQIKCSIPNL